MTLERRRQIRIDCASGGREAYRADATDESNLNLWGALLAIFRGLPDILGEFMPRRSSDGGESDALARNAIEGESLGTRGLPQ